MNAPQTAAPQRRKMTLTSLVKGKKPQPPRVLIYGVEGIGKSSFAAGAPSPVFIGAEDGTAQLDVSRLPVETWQDILDAVDALGAESHEYKTVVLDTLDWAEPKLWEHICARDKQPNIEAMATERATPPHWMSGESWWIAWTDSAKRAAWAWCWWPTLKSRDSRIPRERTLTAMK
jgi:hypothetical protein